MEDLPLEELIPYIDWSPFFMTWELKGKYPRILDDDKLGEAARELFDNGQERMKEIIAKRQLTAKGVYGFWPAASVDDDIVLYKDGSRTEELCRFHTLRQQWQRTGQRHYLALSDFIAPLNAPFLDYLGAFCVTAGIGADELAADFDADHDDYNSILVKSLAGPAGRSVCRETACRRPQAMGLRKAGELLERGPDCRKVSRHPSGAWLSSSNLTTRKRQPCSSCWAWRARSVSG